LADGGGGAGKSAAPIYQKFVEHAKKLNPRYISMIIPSRWFSGGKGLDDFRESMLKDRRLSHLTDFIDSKDCFSNGVDIPGGICYFLWSRDYSGDCMVTNIAKTGIQDTALRKLDEFPTFIRSNSSVNIVHKVLALQEPTMNNQVLSRKPFGLESAAEFDDKGDLVLRNSSGLGRISSSAVLSGHDLIGKWKVIVSKVSFEHAGVPDKTGMMRVLSVVQKLPPNGVCTETYLVVGSFDHEDEADNLVSYLTTKFTRFLLMQMLASMNMSKNSYSFVPVQDFSKPWTDTELYAKYCLSDDEIAFIESMIKPMDITA